ncbi:Hpt domain-containing protein [Massilia sp. CCM 9210]|uniref:hybrid sensor histidine kinase/response regulator n=1 Tax=Massilia scottii TaxID=3057166 RepID=UPI00279686B8|nr:Hpt domain-containing protein [Massilia sp. CCM 9210]MDQ1812556.1 Hpt domain-containing protein [Massilia sp. CCM 9210]
MTTTDNSHVPQFDTGPLSWVMSEIRDALGRSNTALAEAAEHTAEAQASSLKHAKAYLHQAHGALQMVDVDGAGAMTEAAENALDRFKDGLLDCTPERAQVIAHAYQAVIEYLEELLSGAPQQPARLFPYYRALKEMLGADRIHPADLFFADLSAPVSLKRHVAPDSAPDYAACRTRFEKALLPFLKSADQAGQRQHAQVLLEAIAHVADAQDQPLPRTFWMAMQGFAELVAEGHLASDLYVKQLFGLINLQIRRLSQGQVSLPETMLRDALFFMAAVPNPPPTALALRRAYHLDGMVPADYDTRRYGRIDAEALKTAKEALAKAKGNWDRLSVEPLPALETEFEELLATLAEAGEKLGAPALARLQHQMVRVTKDSAASKRNSVFSLEMATAMLFIENSLDKIRQLPDDFDAHAEVIGARLLALGAGETPPEAPQWQGDLSRRIQHEQTVAVLAAEMKNGLRQVEKVLDDYYSDTSKRATLAQIDPVLHQLQGAVAILDQEDAMRAALHVKDAVRTLAAAEGNPELEAASLQNIAQNVGALGFFVDMLAKNVDEARERFTFDSNDGMLRAVPFEKPAHGESQFDQEPVIEIAPVAEAPAPAAPVVVEEQIKAPVVVAAPAPPGDDEIEAELLEIFISEAQEVLAFVGSTLPAAQSMPTNMETLTMLRRSFHTLKGSGRMVGLNNFAEGAAAVEKVMNLWLSEERAADANLLSLLTRATADMTVWVEQLATTGSSQRTSEALVAAAERVQHGEAFSMDAAPAEATPAMADEPVQAATPVDEHHDEHFAIDDSFEPMILDDIIALPATESAAPGNVIDFPVPGTLAAADDNTKRIGELEIPLPLYNIYLAETDELVRLLSQDFAEWRHEPQRQVTPEAEKAAHTLAGTSATVGFHALREIAYEVEMVLKSPAPVFDEAQRDLLDETIDRVRQMLQRFALGELAPAEPDLVARLHVLREQLAAQEAAAVFAGADEDLARRLDGLFADTLDSLVAEPPVMPERESALAQTVSEPEVDAVDALFGEEDPFDVPLLDNPEPAQPMVQEHQEALPEAEPVIEAEPVLDEPMIEAEAVIEAEPVTEDLVLDAEPVLEEQLIEEAALEAELLVEEPVAEEPVLEAEPVLEEQLIEEAALEAELLVEEPVAEEAVLEAEPVIEEAVLEAEPVIEEAVAEAEPVVEAEPAAVVPMQPMTAHVPLLEALLQPESETPAAPAVAETAFADDLDVDLLPVFLEEGTDLLPEIGNNLRKWQQNPSDTTPVQQLLRTLHTVKGSARMAGAMRLGQHTHEIETQIENMVHAGTSTPAAFDELMANYDHALLLFEQLQQPALGVVPVPGLAAAAAGSVDDAHAAQTRTPLVRVRADILDRLVNQAGEVSITRSKLESQVSTLKASLSDFSDNLGRLRRQLREVEMQAESQISSRMSISSEREFDPLEFDRFTRLQELTRMMAESVNDVASFHESLTRTVDGATDDLNVQSRLTRDLQQDLMRVRMVQFASLSERLFRVARQTAKEIDKRVNLDIRGGTVEIDRSVLEQMAAPFEHLLRNAIVHGIESRARRGAAGKAETGELLIQVSQQGNEVVIQFNDDGAGLDLSRIRTKARENGLLAPHAVVTDAEAADLIFEPGFSTADALTELAGRGVGMDVVRSQAQALGGRVAIATEAGKGARFTIHLPLTLAVTQVVLTTSGSKTFALPSILVEQVLQMKEAAVNAAHAEGFVEFQGQKVALHYLPTLLGDAEARPLSQRSCPVMVLKSGADRLAVQVDDIQGNREVVIKNIGPQLSRMIGISGATVLGSGDIVLILNPVALSHHLDHHPQTRQRIVVETTAVVPETRAADFVIMVVDDSLTVRKVTQRLLEREGYQVVLAKDGVDALEHLQETVPHLMLVDIEMPRMDGFDLTRNIRGNSGTNEIPIIMITSRTADKHRNYALDLGVNAYFGKPFQEDMLLAAIAGLLNREMPVAH